MSESDRTEPVRSQPAVPPDHPESHPATPPSERPHDAAPAEPPADHPTEHLAAESPPGEAGSWRPGPPQPGMLPAGQWPAGPAQEAAPGGPWAPPPGGPIPPGGPVTHQPSRRSGLLLGLAVTVFVIAAAVFGTLYLTERSAHDRTKRESSAQLAGMQGELASIKGELNKAQNAESAQRDRIAELETRSDKLKECADASNELLAAIQAQDEARFETAVRHLVQAC